MDGFALPLAGFTVFMVWLLVEVFRGSITDAIPLRAGVTWAITCPVAGFLLGIGLTQFAFLVGCVSVLALGSLAFWFLAHGGQDDDDPPVEPVDPDPSPGDDIDPETLYWDEFDRARSQWERSKVITTYGDSHHFELPA